MSLWRAQKKTWTYLGVSYVLLAAAWIETSPNSPLHSMIVRAVKACPLLLLLVSPILGWCAALLLHICAAVIAGSALRAAHNARALAPSGTTAAFYASLVGLLVLGLLALSTIAGAFDAAPR